MGQPNSTFRITAVLVALTLGVACQGPKTGSSLSHARIGTIQARDGVPISYEMRGQGDTALVFVHCWAGDRSFWNGQVDAFADDYQVVALDLPGHGASGGERAHWTLSSLAEDVHRVIDTLQLNRVILVGHSMGGPVSLIAAQKMPERIIGIVGVDTLQNAESNWSKSVVNMYVNRLTTNFTETVTHAVRSMFPTNANPAVVQWVVDQAHRADRRAVIGLFADFANVDLKKEFASVTAPIRAINAIPNGTAGAPTAVETNRKYANFDVVLMNGVGHYLQLEQPDQFNSALRSVLADIQTSMR